MRNLASELSKTSSAAIDLDLAKKILDAIVKEAKQEAEQGKTECTVRVTRERAGLESCKYSWNTYVFEYHQSNQSNALQKHIRKELETMGFKFDVRYGVNGMYAYIVWGTYE
jgi:hypothetical protein